MAKKKILIIDHATSYAKLVESCLQHDSLEIEMVSQADLALLKIIEWRPDLLITSVEVGNIDGFDLCLILRMIPDFAGMPIILMSSHAGDPTLKKALSVGADYYVAKDGDFRKNIQAGLEKLLLQPEKPVKRPREKRELKTVLVVDDSKTMRRIIGNILKSIGINRIIEASNGAQGLMELDQNTVDMVISDWNMPKMNGGEFIKHIRANPAFNDLYFVLVTAEGAEEIEDTLQAGADGYLNKPFNIESLETLVNAYREEATPGTSES